MSSINHLESIDSGSNYKFGNKMEIARPGRSLFDLSHLVTTDLQKEGIVYPLSIIPTLPGDDHDISADVLLRVMPQVVPLYSRMRMYIYGFYSRWTDLFDKADIFITKGYSGNRDVKMPTLNSKNINLYYSINSTNPNNNTTLNHNTLWDFMGLPQGVLRISSDSDLTTSGYKTISDDIADAHINALPFMMYLRIWRDYFINKNHFINDRIVLPDDDSRFRLNEDGELLSAKDESVSFRFILNQSNSANYNKSGSIATIGLFTHLYPSDYFTSALPFTQRGTPTPLNGSVSASSLTDLFRIVGANNSSDFSTASKGVFLGIGGDGKFGIPEYDGYGLTAKAYGSSPSGSAPSVGDQQSTSFLNFLNAVGGLAPDSELPIDLATVFNNLKFNLTSSGSPVPLSLGIYAEDIRKLFAQQQELEKMARTDGSLGGFGLTFFGEKSKNARDYKPTLIGGCYKNITFTEVLQTSGQTTKLDDGSEVNGSPLGSQAGHGIVGISNGRIGHIHCDDYGYIMLLACIMPDIYYSQGLDKMWSLRSQDEIYIPERSRLGMQPILNKEIFFAGNNGNESGEDNYLWAYQNPFDDYRYKQNRICGQIADPDSKSFFPYTQSRYFSTLPNWGYEFSEASRIRDDYLFAPNESHFTAQFSFNVRSVRPLPYKPIPAKLV